MQFLMGLNDSYSQIKGQILLMEPLPSINKVYSLLIHEERQSNVGNSNAHVESTALAMKGSNFNPAFFGGKNSKGNCRPICSHCGRLGHTMEKCFKLHGFPPGFQPKGKTSMVNQVGVQDDLAENGQSSNDANQFTFTQEQCQQFLTMLGNQIQAAAHLSKDVHMANSVIKHHSDQQATSFTTDPKLNNALTMSGPYVVEDDWCG
ncbi:uncharacterized protein LOC115954102 [Quercus lobata]|uniref:uncharacterized protein LOC115954102 n=1 Tax=Quercus lobata TaxID=97700 RepID=UPI0012477188|nr:uncharacterized protein LOC115954102 [Quercus lobata]